MQLVGRHGRIGYARRTPVFLAAGVLVLGAASVVAAVPAIAAEHREPRLAYLGINICGEWLAGAPRFEAPHRVGLSGARSLGHGMMSIDAGATLGELFENGGWTLTPTVLDLGGANPDRAQWSGPRSARLQTRWEANTDCPFGEYRNTRRMYAQPGFDQYVATRVSWAVDGLPRQGDPARYRPKAGETVAIYFAPALVSGYRFPPRACGALRAAAKRDEGHGPSMTSPCHRLTPRAPRLSTRIVVPRPTVESGGLLDSSLLVFNNSGAPLEFIGCYGPNIGVELGNDLYHQGYSWPACASAEMFAKGLTTYGGSAYVRFAGCSTNPEFVDPSSSPMCPGDGTMPPLPPGHYQATMVQTSETSDLGLPLAKPVQVEVTAVP